MQNYKIIITRNTSVYTFYNLCFALVKDMEVDTQVVCLSFDYVPVSALPDLCSPFLRYMSSIP